MSVGEEAQSSEPGLNPYPDSSSSVGVKVSVELKFSKKVVYLLKLLCGMNEKWKHLSNML